MHTSHDCVFDPHDRPFNYSDSVSQSFQFSSDELSGLEHDGFLILAQNVDGKVARVFQGVLCSQLNSFLQGQIRVDLSVVHLVVVRSVRL